MNQRLIKYVEQYSRTLEYQNPDILFDLTDEIQSIVQFTFAIEPNKKSIMPKLKLGTPDEEVDSSRTVEYEGPELYIKLSKRRPVGSDKTDKKTFEGNLTAGTPRFSQKIKLDDGTVIERKYMKYDNEFQLILVTKTTKEALEFIPLIERALNVNSRLIMPTFIDVSGIIETKTLDNKTTDKTIRTQISYQVRSQETVDVDNSYILKGYQIFTNELETGSGTIVDDEWIQNKDNGEFIEFPGSYIGGKE
jgi:hypothetical protein